MTAKSRKRQKDFSPESYFYVKGGARRICMGSKEQQIHGTQKKVLSVKKTKTTKYKNGVERTSL